MDVSPLCYKLAYEPHTVVEGQGHFAQTPITTNYTTSSVMKHQIYKGMRGPWRRFYCRVKPLTTGCTICSVTGALGFGPLINCFRNRAVSQFIYLV